VKEPPQIEGPYRLLRPLGAGGMGAVWEAEYTPTGQRRALKVMHVQAVEDLARFRREAEALGALDHPHLVRVHEARLEGPQPYLVQELLSGGSLGDRLQAGPLPVEQARELARQVAEGVAAAHRAGILHRDLKPDNVLLDERGAAKVTDFGLACVGARGERLTRTGEILGTPDYMAPEQAIDSARVDERADVYALGGVLYAMLTGRAPLDTAGRSLIASLAALQDELPPSPEVLNPEVPAQLAAVCRRALAKDPARRYASAKAFAAALSAPPDVPAPARRGLWIGAALLLASSVVAWSWVARSVAPEPAAPRPDVAPVASQAPPPALGSPEFVLPATVGSSRVLGAIVDGEVVTAQRNYVSFWDGRSESPRRQERVGPRSSSIEDLEITESGTVLVCGEGLPVVRITREGKHPVPGLSSARCVAERGGRLAYGLSSGAVVVLGSGQGAREPQVQRTEEGYPVEDLVWLDSDRLLAITRQGDVAVLYTFFFDAAGRLLPRSNRFLSDGATHAVSLGGGRFALGNRFGGASYLPRPPGQELAERVETSMLGKAECADLLVIRDGLLVIAARGVDRYQNRLFFHRSGGAVQFYELEFTPSSLAVDADEQVLLVCGEDGEARLLQVDALLARAGAE